MILTNKKANQELCSSHKNLNKKPVTRYPTLNEEKKSYRVYLITRNVNCSHSQLVPVLPFKVKNHNAPDFLIKQV